MSCKTLSGTFVNHTTSPYSYVMIMIMRIACLPTGGVSVPFCILCIQWDSHKHSALIRTSISPSYLCWGGTELGLYYSCDSGFRIQDHPRQLRILAFVCMQKCETLKITEFQFSFDWLINHTPSNKPTTSLLFCVLNWWEYAWRSWELWNLWNRKRLNL